MNITLTGEAAVAMKYAVMLARIQAPELDGLTDDQTVAELADRLTSHKTSLLKCERRQTRSPPPRNSHPIFGEISSRLRTPDCIRYSSR